MAIGQQLVERGAVAYLIQRPGELSGRDLSTPFTVQMTLGFLTGVMVFIAAPRVAIWYGEDDLNHLLTAVGVALLAYSVRAIPLGLLERSMSYGRVAVTEVIDILAFSFIAILGVAGGLGLWALSLAIIARSLASLVAAYALQRVFGMRVALSLSALRNMAGYAAPYALANGLSWVNTAAAPILVGTIVGVREFGIVHMSYALIVLPQVLTGIIGRVAFPAYARETNPELVAARVESGTIALTRYAGGATLVVAVTSLIWVPLIYGPAWTGTSTYMLIIAPVYALERSLSLFIAALSAVGKVTALLATGLSFSLLYWTSAVMLIPSVCAIGLPLAYALASLSFLIYVVAYRRAVGPTKMARALLEFCALSLLLALAAAWSLTSESTAGVAVIAVVMGALILRHVPFRALLPQRARS
jgi:teichuronic acid exporter